MSTSQVLQHIESKVNQVIYETYPEQAQGSTLAIPSDKSKSDLVISDAFAIANKRHETPIDVAKTIAEKLNQDTTISAYVVFRADLPGFINLSLTDIFLKELAIEVITAQDAYGSSNTLAGKTWVVEHTSPNPNKAMHLGHLRTNLIGMSIANISEASGAKTIRDAVDNNRGIAMTKAMWGFLVGKKKDGARVTDIHYWFDHQDEWHTPASLSQKADHFVGDCYLLGSDEYKSNQESATAIRQMVVDWESGDKITWSLWEQILGYAHEGIDQTLAKLGNRWDKVWHEHEHYKLGKELVDEGLAKGVFKKLEDGAVLSNLEDYKLSDTILLKSDGTSLYITQDLALTRIKKEFYKADKLIWVIGPEQALAMKQVFAISEQLGTGKLSEFDHVSYGLVNILDKEGNAKKMSSRGGEVVFIDQLIDQVKDTLLKSDRGYTEEAAESIGVAAIKIAVLKPSRNSNVVIDLNNLLQIEGDSGVYLFYTYARISSLLEKHTPDTLVDLKLSDQEKELLVRVLYFPMIVKGALNEYSPNIIVEYLFELSHLFNSLYASQKFITDNKQDTDQKMLIAQSLSIVFKNAFKLLGVNPPTKI